MRDSISDDDVGVVKENLLSGVVAHEADTLAENDRNQGDGELIDQPGGEAKAVSVPPDNEIALSSAAAATRSSAADRPAVMKWNGDSG